MQLLLIKDSPPSIRIYKSLESKRLSLLRSVLLIILTNKCFRFHLAQINKSAKRREPTPSNVMDRRSKTPMAIEITESRQIATN